MPCSAGGSGGCRQRRWQQQRGGGCGGGSWLRCARWVALCLSWMRHTGAQCSAGSTCSCPALEPHPARFCATEEAGSGLRPAHHSAARSGGCGLAALAAAEVAPAAAGAAAGGEGGHGQVRWGPTNGAASWAVPEEITPVVCCNVLPPLCQLPHALHSGQKVACEPSAWTLVETSGSHAPPSSEPPPSPWAFDRVQDWLGQGQLKLQQVFGSTPKSSGSRQSKGSRGR